MALKCLSAFPWWFIIQCLLYNVLRKLAKGWLLGNCTYIIIWADMTTSPWWMEEVVTYYQFTIKNISGSTVKFSRRLIAMCEKIVFSCAFECHVWDKLRIFFSGKNSNPWLMWKLMQTLESTRNLELCSCLADRQQKPIYFFTLISCIIFQIMNGETSK